MDCCSKFICHGCNYANQMREAREKLKPRCAFCRNPMPKSKEAVEKSTMKRVKKNDPVAICQMGKARFIEKGDHEGSFEYYTKAAELGDVEAHYCLASSYKHGNGVEKDEKKEVYHLEHAAICGHTWARDLLAYYEEKNGNSDRAAKHHIINANLGFEPSLKYLKDLFVRGVVSKEDYGAALRGYQAAVVAAKSPERENAEEAMKNGLSKSFRGEIRCI